MSNAMVRKLEHGAVLSDGDRETLTALLDDRRHIEAREDVIREGERPDRLHVVLEGFACRYKMVADGGRQIMAWLVPGDFCDLHVALLGEMDHNIATLSRCTMAFVPRQQIEALTTRHNMVNRALWWATLVDEAVLREWMVGMGRRPADRQIAHLFCELLVRLGAVGLTRGMSYDLPVTQDDLADTLGMTSVHVNRVLQQLRHDGMITLHDKTLTILDVERLNTYAGFDPNYLHLNKRAE